MKNHKIIENPFDYFFFNDTMIIFIVLLLAFNDEIKKSIIF